MCLSWTLVGGLRLTENHKHGGQDYGISGVVGKITSNRALAELEATIHEREEVSILKKIFM